MIHRSQRDTYLTIGGLLAIVVAFYFCIQRPAESTSKELQADIDRAQRELTELPMRLAEVAALKKEVALCNQYIDESQPLLLNGASLHKVIREVADFAGRHRLNVLRLEPMSPEVHETYQRIPFQIQFQGPFHGVMQLVSEMEQSEHLFTVQQLSLSRDIRRNGTAVDGNMHFSVYVGHTEAAGSVENSSSAGVAVVDSNR